MDKVTIEITKEEAALLPLLLKVKVETELGAAHKAAQVEEAAKTLIQKANAAFAPKEETKE